MSEDNRKSRSNKAQAKTKPIPASVEQGIITDGFKSRRRVRDNGEVFTPTEKVREMCDLCEPEISDPSARILEPGCGTGNFLVEILQRRIERLKTQGLFDQYEVLKAISTIYGVDISADNVSESRSRMRNIVFDCFADTKLPASFLLAMDTILKANICQGNLMTGRKRIQLIEWVPVGQSFKLQPWTLAELDEHLSRAKFAPNINELPKTYEELSRPPDRPTKPKAKPKIKHSPKQTKLF